MRGQVIHVHHQRGMVAVETNDGDYSIIELLGDDIQEGDELQWKENHPLGAEVIQNVTQGGSIEVYFQNHCVPKHQLRQQLLYR